MRWIKPVLRHSISALLGSETLTRRPAAVSLEPLRQAMLATLGNDGEQLNPRLMRRLQHLHDALAFWYARPEVLAVLSQVHGEAKAALLIRDLTPCFKGHIPASLMDAQRFAR
jgi:hypothetical protein